MKIGNVIASTLAALWGLGVVIYGIGNVGRAGGGSYGAGADMALLFGVVLLFVGVRGVWRELAKRRGF